VTGLASAVAMILALSSPQTTPPQTPQGQITPLEDVVVEGRSREEVARSFVDAIADPLPGRGPSRWDRSVCIGVANLREDVSQYMVDRISEIARQVGLTAGEPGCRPDVLIVATDNGNAMAGALVEARPRLFNTGMSGTNQSRAALREFQENDDPVRWWHVSLPVDSETGLPATQIPGYGPSTINVFSASRLRTQVQNDLQRVFIIVDFSRAGAVDVVQLSDYLAMVALAQVDPDAQTGSFDTVLNLFEVPSAPPSLTDWDKSYLRALYTAELDRTSPGAQRGEVAAGMVRDPPPPEPDTP
jgi:hypothetical protein